MKRLIPLIMAALLLCGCVPHTELDKLAIAEAVGIDYENGEYTVTLQYFNTDASGGVTAVDSSAPNAVTAECGGKTIESALEGLSYKTGKEIMLGAVGVIVFGRDAVFALQDSLGFTASHYSGNFCSYITAADGKASDILAVKFKEGNASVEKIEAILRNAEKLGLTRPVKMSEAAEMLSCPTASVVLPQFTAYSGNAEMTEDGKSLILSGGALCTGDAYAGAFGSTEMCGLAMLSPGADSGRSCEMPLVVGDSETTVMLYRIKRDIVPSLSDGKLHLDVKIGADCKYVSTNLDDPYARRETVEKLCEQETVRRVSAALEKALHGYGADAFGLGYVIRAYSPALWDGISGRYRDVLKSCTFSISSSVTMERFGITRGT